MLNPKDGKGGIAIAIEDILHVPIRFVGLGENIEDLEAFNPEIFTDSLI